ncbi:hypothetical protein SKAU_G00190660 [Synaphobranchus kaupii]|uniref:Sushi domain-containing protein n=1 Tax=Synaphobranchus kaupii TaxID=118154 RepID=A0A9Q1IV60_SYNKA|nr:hypothetical protein SKAU_G00190660 [Synaphobranchus kaupii]
MVTSVQQSAWEPKRAGKAVGVTPNGRGRAGARGPSEAPPTPPLLQQPNGSSAFDWPPCSVISHTRRAFVLPVLSLSPHSYFPPPPLFLPPSLYLRYFTSTPLHPLPLSLSLVHPESSGSRRLVPTSRHARGRSSRRLRRRERAVRPPARRAEMGQIGSLLKTHAAPRSERFPLTLGAVQSGIAPRDPPLPPSRTEARRRVPNYRFINGRASKGPERTLPVNRTAAAAVVPSPSVASTGIWQGDGIEARCRHGVTDPYYPALYGSPLWPWFRVDFSKNRTLAYRLTEPIKKADHSATCHIAIRSAGKHADPRCPRPSAVQHGWVNLTESNRGSFPPGTFLQYSCEQGFAVDGPSAITCTASGRWSPDPPHCIRADVCRPPYEPENGGYTCHPSPCHRLIHGTVIEYFCDEGYALKGDYKYLTCENGEWDSPMQISCHLSQGTVLHSPLGVPALSIVASTASSVALILLLIVLFVLLQPKLKSFHHSRREQGVPGHPVSIVVEGVQVSLPSYEEAVYGSGGGAVAPSESRVQIVLSEGPQAEGGEAPGPSGAERGVPAPSSHSPSPSSHLSETVLVHQMPSSSSSSSSSPSWVSEQPCAAAPRPQRQDSESSDQHSLLSFTSAEEFADDIPLLKEA